MFTKADIEKYFNAEKSESLLFIVIGITAILLALIFFLYLKTNWHKGFAIPFLIVGLMHLAVGYTVYKRCDADRKRNVYAYDMTPGDFKTSEIPRMEKVKSNFVVYRFTEIALLLAGAALFFYFRNNTGKSFWAGFGMALAIEAAISLGADFIAEKRAHQYITGIQTYLDQLK
jgi:drug/metabolite transporter (DMT)-like permease